ncbi:MAG: hypothetical protein OXF93_03260 [Acidobacteria bacterium]|nr:hypothetical protein [Acidobacteriota bacterium]
MIRIASMGVALAIVFGGAPAPAEAQSVEVGDVLTIASGEVREGDLYAAGEAVRVDGRLNGDLVAGARRILVDGRVEGDLFAAGNTIDLRGPIGDSTRIVGQILTVDTTIDGDLLAGGEELYLTENASVAGGLTAAASLVEIDGTVGRGARVAAGEIIVRGTVNGDVNVIADHLDLAPGARITGDLDYRARTPLSPEAAAQVEGAVRYEEPVEDPDNGGGGFGFLFWFWQVLASLLTGIVVVAALRGVVERLVASIAEETTLGALLGFTAFLLIPVAAAIAIVTLVGLPIGVAAVLLFGLALYAAKLPIAVWIGGRLLGLAGRPGASPYTAMAVGILLLYLLFAIPFVGWLFWLAATWLGLGAMVVAGRRYLDSGASAA